MNTEKKWYASSANAEKLSLTIKGLVVGAIPAIIFVGGIFGYNFVEVDLIALVDSIATVFAAVMITVGLLRKFYLKYFK